MDKLKNKLKQLEKALLESEERFRKVTENVLEWIWEVDTEGKYTYASPTVIKILGYTPEQLLKKHFYDLFSPEDREELKKASFDTFQKRQSFREFENRNIHKNGKTVWLSTSGAPLFDVKRNFIGYRGADIDITERKQADQALQESEARYRTLQANIPVGVFRTSADPSGRLLSANPALARMFGYENPQAMTNISVADLYSQTGDRKNFIKAISSTGEIVNYEVQFKKKNGITFWGSLTARAISDKHGSVEFFDGILEDIAERKRIENLHTSIYKISEAVHSTKNLDELYCSIHTIISELMPARNFYIALYDSSTNTISFEYYVDEIDQDKTKTSRKFAKGFTEYVLNTGKPLVANEETVKKLKKSGKLKPYGPTPIDWLGIPLKTQDKIIGVLAVQSYSKGIRLGKKNMDVLKFVSTQIAMAIERKAAEKALTESEQKYRWVVDNSLAGLYITQQHVLRFCNQRFVEMFGYENPQELFGIHIRKLVTPANWQLVEKQVKLRESGSKQTIHYEFEGVKKDGTIFNLEALGSRIIYMGKTAIQGTMLDITERTKAEGELRRFATTDVLTGVFNRGYGLLLFGKKLRDQKDSKLNLCICYIDVDGLKEINDTYGHKEGDEALKLVSEFLAQELGETENFICRLGGDEFLLIFPKCPLTKAETMWQHISRRLKSFNARNLKPYSISLSSGFAEFDPVRPKTVDQLIATADYEMYKDKQSKHRGFR